MRAAVRMALLSGGLVVACAAVAVQGRAAQEGTGRAGTDTPFRPPVGFTDEAAAPPLAKEITDDRRRARNYPEQPPVIPHNIVGYQVNLQLNQCLTCHSRQYTEQVQAPMVSISHYQTREGQTLGAVAPRRYFCTQCHVPQTDARPVVENRFRPFDALVEPTPDSGSGR
ncbi:nitrate reductase cytochrome c-type subunit [Rhodospirillum centenum]|uniref:Periplasmic nitrate reductase, electron transfer subunit n=1 Tax=Rhodospirillum centenum (strain ATCC 51521 / SW) TaxID=414684 RepID=B6IR11_RHOCS|nr:nitrate reductase cytochrome c-type subunit [Rhodospirillum centenum]ACI97897.1 Diheme cytochrome c napB [Rhodospirillum centenum SW]